ncbi:hypothetical protein QAD02_012881 [Eretmocerus hayati]|uniref:Uncharacterized protein n=1 Tax=Eretmocerus hayati TaxID=131215 RepID=A0ACC2P0P4_9HYME|nr:hypothetical protein QAD02_012881 [Eretmocerus hayati]
MSRNVARRGRRPSGLMQDDDPDEDIGQRPFQLNHVRHVENQPGFEIRRQQDDECAPVSPAIADSPDSPDPDSSNIESTDGSSSESGDIPAMPRAIPIDDLRPRDQVVPDLEQQNADQQLENQLQNNEGIGDDVQLQPPREDAIPEERNDQQEQGVERQRGFDERMEKIRERAWRGAVEAALGGDPPHVVIQRQIEEENRRAEAEEQREREERGREERRQEERRREEQIRERILRWQGLQNERRRREGPHINRNHNRVIRIEAQRGPRVLAPPAPGLMAGVVPFANLLVPRNEGELDFFEAIDANQFLAVNGQQGPTILHVNGLCTVAPDGSTWRCLRCVRNGTKNGFRGWEGWWMHHLHLTGLEARIRMMRCPGCHELAFTYHSRHSCQACLEVYFAHRSELLLGVVFEAMIGRVIMGQRNNSGHPNYRTRNNVLHNITLTVDSKIIQIYGFCFSLVLLRKNLNSASYMIITNRERLHIVLLNRKISQIESTINSN